MADKYYDELVEVMIPRRLAIKLKNILAKNPDADVVEVKHGYNKTSMHPVDEFWCSECGFCCADYTEYDEDGDYTYSCECEFDYCPQCGAKMDGRSDKK